MTVPGSPAPSNPPVGGTAPEPAPTNPPVGGSTPSPAAPNPQAGGEPISQDRIREIMRENQQLRAREKAAEEAKQAADLAKLGDVERLTKQLEIEAASREAAQARAAQTEAKLLAKDLGIVYPDIAVAAIKDQLKIGKDGSLENAEDLLKAFITAHPLMAAQQTPPTTQAAPQVGVQPANPSRSSQQSQGVQPGFDPAHPPSWRDVPRK